MMKRQSAIILALLAVCVTPTVLFAEVKFEAALDQLKIARDETANLSIYLESDAGTLPEPELPVLDDFDVYSSGRNQTFRMVNGRTQTSVRYRYVLAPRDVGRFRIGPATVVIDGKKYETEPLTLTVTAARMSAPAPSPPAPDPKVAGQSNHKIFITASLDKDTAFVNEQVTYIFRFYRAERLLSSPEYTRPSFPGFWVEELPPQRKFTTQVNGIAYEVTEIRIGLFPTDAGEKAIEPARLKATIRSERQTRTSPFGTELFGFFGGGEDLHLKTSPVTLTVLPLPTRNKPEDWGGLVGQFEITAKADLREVNVGDPITVGVTIRGNGNVKSIPKPVYDSVPDFRTFSAGSSEDISKAGYRVSGTRTFDEVFVPHRPGTYSLPPFRLTFFDPGARIYRTVATDSIPVTVTGGAADFTIPSFRLTPDELSDLAADVRFLKTESDHLRRAGDPGLFGWAFWFGHLTPLIGLAVLIGWRRRVLHEAADPARRRRRLAYRLALERLNGDAHGKTGGKATVDVIAQALLQYYSDRYNTPAQGKLRSEMLTTMSRDGVTDMAAREFVDLLERCDHSRFAPEQSGGDIADLAGRARTVLGTIEKSG